MEEEKKELETPKNEELLKQVEAAARRGAGSISRRNLILSLLPTLIVLVLIAVFVIPKVNDMNRKLAGFTTFDTPVVDHDLVVENNGIFGYTAADFEEAILGKSNREKKLEVMTQEVSDAVNTVNTGMFNWSIFTKTQLITYHGTVVYTVDLSELGPADITVDEENKLIIMRIPHARQEEINIPEKEMQFGDVEHGMLAFGEIKMSVEQSAQIQEEARAKMQAKLDEEHALDAADRFAKLSVWEMYSPIIKGVARNYSLEVEFRG